jgi:hypothetical protein
MHDVVPIRYIHHVLDGLDCLSIRLFVAMKQAQQQVRLASELERRRDNGRLQGRKVEFLADCHLKSCFDARPSHYEIA